MNDNSYKVVDIDINEILPNRFQPRIQFDEDEILELSDSIKEHGVIQPIVVRTIGDKYEIIAGERRYKASVLAGKETVPVIIKNLNDKDSAEIALIENIQRKNLTPIEEALSYKKILDMGYLTQEGLANKLGKSQSSVANKVRLLNLSDEVQEALLDNKISERHARSLLRLKNGLQQNEMLEKIIEQRLTVRKTDEEIDKVLEGRIEEKGEVDMNNEVSQIPNVVMNTENSFDIFGNNTAPTPEVPAMPEMVSAPVVEMPAVAPVIPEVPSVPVVETPVPSMPSVGGIQFDANGNVIAAPTPEVPAMPEMVSAPVVEMPAVTPVIPEVPSVPVVETPVPSMPSVGGIQFDANGNVIAAPTPEVPAMPEMVSAPVVEMPAVTPVIPEVPSVPVVETPVPSMPSVGGIQFDANGNVIAAPTPEVPAMPEMVSAPVVEMPAVAPVIPEVPSVPVVETPVPSMPSVGGIQFDANGNVIAAPTPEVPAMPEMVSAPVVEMPAVTPVIPEVPSVPVVETPVPSMPSVGGIQFDANGNVIAVPTPEVPAMPEMVSAPVVEMPAVAPVMPEVPQTAPIQEISNVASEINNNISTIEPIIITDYNKQYDPVMPNSNIVEDNKVDFKEIINEIRECSKRIEQFGYKIDVEEYDLSTIYQVVFKIEK